MKKPKKITKSYFVYTECRDYLENKFNYKEREYLDKNNQCQDFWHWIIINQNPPRGSFMTFDYFELQEIQEEWAKEIYAHYLEEFGENKKLEMFVDW